MTDNRRRRFRELHATGLFLMPNPWDAGSARLLAHAGFPAVATTSLGAAISMGRRDGQVSSAELVEHAGALAAAVDVPVSVDSERCFDDIAATVDALAAVGAAGLSIEDYDRSTGILPVDVATERVGTAVEAAGRHGLVLTARAENHFHGVDDLDDTIARLVAYRDAGADVVYAPGLRSLDDIARVVSATGVPVNVLAVPGGPSTGELAAAGVRRVSTGGALARAAYGEMLRAAEELRTAGTTSYARRAPGVPELYQAFD